MAFWILLNVSIFFHDKLSRYLRHGELVRSLNIVYLAFYYLYVFCPALVDAERIAQWNAISAEKNIVELKFERVRSEWTRHSITLRQSYTAPRKWCTCSAEAPCTCWSLRTWSKSSIRLRTSVALNCKVTHLARVEELPLSCNSLWFAMELWRRWISWSDVKARLSTLRGKGMPDCFSWSYKRWISLNTATLHCTP